MSDNSLSPAQAVIVLLDLAPTQYNEGDGRVSPRDELVNAGVT